jgi:hypothetical protein
MTTAPRVTIEVTADDLLAINNALNEVCHGPAAPDDWEFQTRMGVSRSEAKVTLDLIRSNLAKVR